MHMGHESSPFLKDSNSFRIFLQVGLTENIGFQEHFLPFLINGLIRGMESLNFVSALEAQARQLRQLNIKPELNRHVESEGVTLFPIWSCKKSL